MHVWHLVVQCHQWRQWRQRTSAALKQTAFLSIAPPRHIHCPSFSSWAFVSAARFDFSAHLYPWAAPWYHPQAPESKVDTCDQQCIFQNMQTLTDRRMWIDVFKSFRTVIWTWLHHHHICSWLCRRRIISWTLFLALLNFACTMGLSATPLSLQHLVFPVESYHFNKWRLGQQEMLSC